LSRKGKVDISPHLLTLERLDDETATGINGRMAMRTYTICEIKIALESDTVWSSPRSGVNTGLGARSKGRMERKEESVDLKKSR